MKRDFSTILAITNHRSLAHSLERLVRLAFIKPFEFATITYDMCPVQLSPGLIKTKDLFLLELMRNYPAGLRAEGIVLGKRLALQGKCVLVVSSLSLPFCVRSRHYWDLADTESLVSRIKGLSNEPEFDLESWSRMEAAFDTFLAIPPQH